MTFYGRLPVTKERFIRNNSLTGQNSPLQILIALKNLNSLEVKDLVIKRGIRTAIDGLSLTLKAGHLYLLEAPMGGAKLAP